MINYCIIYFHRMETIFTVVFLLSAVMMQSCAVTNDFSPLLMDIEWILQGKSFGFSGFFVELLGISRSIKTVLPNLRLTQSFFYESFDESPLPSSTVCTDSADLSANSVGQGIYMNSAV